MESSASGPETGDPEQAEPDIDRKRRLGPRLRVYLRRFWRNDKLVVSVLALVVGLAAGYGATFFRWVVGLVQGLSFGSSQEHFYAYAATLPWWQILLVPTLGGLAVGLFVRFVVPGGRPQGVADVIEASALRGGSMSLTTGLAVAATSAASIGVGASVGREGPVVHLGASLASSLSRRLHLGRSQQQTLLGCGVAAAIAASFNAPLAGVIFALEVVVGHYALSAFAPIVIASVVGTLIAHAIYGSFPAFGVPGHMLVSFWEFPAFALLGLLSALAAILFMRSIIFTSGVAERMPVPSWLRPAAGGLAVGMIALVFPHVLGVGYGATTDALLEQFDLWLLLCLIVAKTAATAISLGCGFGGGVFSPSLVVGAMLGGAFGIIATAVFPDLSSGHGAYTLIGMGAVAGAVLGAPISTILIVFELTGDYALTVAVMVAVVTASLVTQQVHGRSFFIWQLERRGLNVKGGREEGLLRQRRVRDVMDPRFDRIAPDTPLSAVRHRLLASPNAELFVLDDGGELVGTITYAEIGEAAFDTSHDEDMCAADIARRNPPVLYAGDDLDRASKRLGAIGEPHIAVLEDRNNPIMIGLVHERDIMIAYQRCLMQARREERGEA